ncbi:NAD(P)H-dependent oxidoreductase [Chryseobacterium sp. L7]|uniref:FMN dependent NADH:quinone oxidoreductase n=1 Tax=Chryseobacterium endalhagicum TaxID=2797638 RepID=A0ABS1QIQ4_9FLAO|nr:NAD(P)H-dependent oxidoreductase [Chryseobacterium endalhagicum]MBL1222485.1 NAD(P)H-dependent oxidoreductase [Chryseobacterium endalhagicum]
MHTLLRIDSSIRIQDSYSRRMGDYFVSQWTLKHSNGTILERDMARAMLPHLSQNTVNGFFDDSIFSEELSLSDELIEELYQSSEILITCPMYNYGIPSSLKAYFDLIVRTKKTFTADSGIKGLLHHKKAHIISVMGGVHSVPGGMNPLEIHVTSILNHLGITDISYFPLEGTAFPQDLSEKTKSVETLICKHLN